MTTPSLSTRAIATSAVVLLAGAAFAGPAAADPGKGKGKGHDKGRTTHEAAKDPSSRSSSPSSTGSSGDPAGNNGTFKVDGLPYSDGMANEPHVTCGFRLKLFGFDEGQTGDITIAGQAPSGSGVVSSRTGVLISDDPAGGGPNDPDALVEYTASDLDLAGLTAHPKQGYHLKVTLSTDTPGGVKHKVFWFQPCESAVTPEVGGTVTTPTVGGTTEESRETGTTPADVLGVKLTRTTGTAPSGSTQVLGTTTSRPGALPFTGSNVLVLAAAGVLLVAVGGGTLSAAAASRRS